MNEISGIQRIAVRALAGLELGVLGGLLTEAGLVLAALLFRWGWPSWGALALHIVICGVAGMLIAIFSLALRNWRLLPVAGIVFSFAVQWFVQRYVWHWLISLAPQQAPGWAYWTGAIALGLIFAMIPTRARSYERDFLLK